MNKLKWAWKLFRSNTYLLLTDKESVINIPLAKLETFDNVFLLTAQAAALRDFKARLEETIKEHDAAVKTLSNKNGRLFGKVYGVNDKAKKASR